MWWGRREYVPVAARIAKGKKESEKLRKKGMDIQPVAISGRKIAVSFWGKGWCDHMDSFHDYENRLPRGRAYVRNGSVVHLAVSKGVISALVAGSSLYTVEIRIDLLPEKRWAWIKEQCAGHIASLVDLLKGRLSDGVMRVVANRDGGLFPDPKEFTMRCSCPDYADMCKHVAAVIYGVGARLDSRPELLFLLRGVDYAELAVDGGVDVVIDKGRGAEGELAGVDLAEMFGIDLVGVDTPAAGKAIPAAIPHTPPAASRREKPKKNGGKKPGTAVSSAASGTGAGKASAVKNPSKAASKRQATRHKCKKAVQNA